MLGFKENFKRSNDNDVFTTYGELNKATNTAEAYSSRCQRLFDQVEAAGSEISYRCVNCSECKACKNHQEIEAISIKEEVEQSIINSSMKVDVKNHITTASLPFIRDPAAKLAPNKTKAMKVYKQQLKKLNHPKK